jgi:hypothetical protein
MMAAPYYKNSPLHGLPEGTISFTRFALRCGVAPTALTRHIAQGIDGERIPVTKADFQERLCSYLTPDQQRAAFAFWDKHHVKYRKPVSARESEAAL